MKSTLFTLKARDYAKSFIMAVGTPLLYFVQEAIPGWDIHPAGKIAIAAAVAYLIKNFFTDDVKAADKIIEEAVAANKK